MTAIRPVCNTAPHPSPGGLRESSVSRTTAAPRTELTLRGPIGVVIAVVAGSRGNPRPNRQPL